MQAIDFCDRIGRSVRMLAEQTLLDPNRPDLAKSRLFGPVGDFFIVEPDSLRAGENGPDPVVLRQSLRFGIGIRRCYAQGEFFVAPRLQHIKPFDGRNVFHPVLICKPFQIGNGAVPQ